ncbi:FliH/SctL family protein [Geomonas sp.]|uniref:FliH/SctL family protein n=1 Tax=Geomonas sp. TaxID=2651584 RepID=UPI002B48F9E1|nr:FliH/SctL family protein [Geomonas sp.]HJV34589.1 FliH/SctL family protein [Geomonas sp.]
MCSCKIIRRGEEGHAPYTLLPLGGELAGPIADQFRPVTLGGEEPEPALNAAETEPAEAAPPVCIPEEEAHRLIREARAEGYRQGKEEAEAAFATVTETMGKALAALGSLRAQLMHEAEEDLLKLSVLVARKVMLREFACDPGIMVGLVQSALEVASEGGAVLVRLNPDEYQVLIDCREFQELLQANPSITLKPDPAVGRAGCLVETMRGNIDAGVDAQLDEILRRLCEERTARREDVDG